jgi:DNA-binding LacI/PurR family transcriptional regulator
MERHGLAQAKYIQIADAFRRRIYNGDYSFSKLPGAQRLAGELGVSYLTARQAVGKLIDEGVLRRQANGRLEVCSPVKQQRENLNIALISPCDLNGIWSNAICQAAQNFNCSFRSVSYSHDDDPVIFEVLNGDFDLIFIAFVRSDSLFLNKLLQHKDKVVTLFHDFTELGIRCFDGPPPSTIGILMKYLMELGHRKIDFLNTQPVSRTVAERIRAWQQSKEELGFTGKLNNFPVQSFESAALHAHEMTHRLLDDPDFDATALFCFSVEAASGVLRACYEKGVRVGKDLSVCSFAEPEKAKLLIPSITIVDRPSPVLEATAIIEQFLQISDTPERLLFRPQSKELVIGESTGSPVVKWPDLTSGSIQ